MDPKPPTAKEQFLDAVSQYSPNNSFMLRIGKASVMINDGSNTPFDLNDNQVYIQDVRADEPGEGEGTRALKIMGGLADMFNIEILADIVGSSQGQPYELARAQRFYQKNGYVAHPSDPRVMVRGPSLVAGEGGPGM